MAAVTSSGMPTVTQEEATLPSEREDELSAAIGEQETAPATSTTISQGSNAGDGKGLGGWIKRKFPDMERDKVDSLAATSREAYEKEVAGQWSQAYDLHEGAINLWSEFAKSANMFSNTEKTIKKLALQRCELHKRRLKVIQPFAKDGKPVPDNIIMHPSRVLANMGLAELLSPAELPLPEDFHDHILRLSLQEHATSQQPNPNLTPYTSSLPDNTPATEYMIKREVNMVGRTLMQVVCTIYDASHTNEVLILESWFSQIKNASRITEAIVYRPADHPIPAMRIVPAPHFEWQTTGMAMTTYISGLQAPIVEAPDTPGKSYWGPRRFVYGGRKFVRKPLEPGKPEAGEAVYEYTETTPQEGSKTGKLVDDALPQRLFWIDGKSGLGKETRCFAAAGLDPLFREYIFAVQMIKLAIQRCGSSPPKTRQQIEVEENANAALNGARIVVGLMFALAIGGG